MKLLQLDVGSPGQNTALCVHSSLAAAAAWRYAQLLTVLPKRETEAELWRSCAERYHEQSGKAKQYIDHSALKDDLGPLDLLKGHESTSDGMVIDLVLRRALPCVRFDQE